MYAALRSYRIITCIILSLNFYLGTEDCENKQFVGIIVLVILLAIALVIINCLFHLSKSSTQITEEKLGKQEQREK